jgi:hypothetical protein
LEYYVKTSELYENVERGTYVVPENFWGTNSFVLLRSKTYDNRVNLDVAAVSFASICTDERCETIVEPPPDPPQPPCVDLVNSTIACVIRDERTVVVPAGAFQATRSIVLRHPNALLVMEAGAQITFSPGTSIQVHQGTLKVVGTQMKPVILTSEIGSSWAGIWFGSGSTSTQFSADTYVDGPLLRECTIKNAASAVSMQQVSVLLDGVSIQDSGSSVGSSAISLSFTQTRALLQNVAIQAHTYGIVLSNVASSVTLQNVSISNSTGFGLYVYSCNAVFVKACAFQRSSYGHILYSGGSGELAVSAR